MKAQTVVVQRQMRDTRDEPAPEGWELSESTDFADVWRRTGDVPKVQINDPLDGHKKLLRTYTDKEMHDLTAYLVTWK